MIESYEQLFMYNWQTFICRIQSIDNLEYCKIHLAVPHYSNSNVVEINLVVLRIYLVIDWKSAGTASQWTMYYSFKTTNLVLINDFCHLLYLSKNFLYNITRTYYLQERWNFLKQRSFKTVWKNSTMIWTKSTSIIHLYERQENTQFKSSSEV